MNFFTADIHLWHQNILELEKRPFSNLEFMHEQIKEKWNKKVSEEDDVWIIGDVAFCKHQDMIRDFLKTLDGKKHLVLGNHDDRYRALTWIKMGFVSIHTALPLTINLEEVWLAHHPDAREIYNLPKYCTLLHGHTHMRGPKFEQTGRGWNINVGMDQWGFVPVTLGEIRTEIDKKITEAYSQ